MALNSARKANLFTGPQGPAGVRGPAGADGADGSDTYTPTGSWQGSTPDTKAIALDQLSNSVAQRFVFVRNFCPLSELSHFANLAPTAAFPRLLTDGFNTLAKAEAAFPLSTAAGDLSSGTYATNSLDWACINEAVRYGEATLRNTVWLDHGAYGIIGNFVCHAGTAFMGQGATGAQQDINTAIVYFGTGDLFTWLGDYDPFSTGGFHGEGGGVQNVFIWKADRHLFGGTSYTGGRVFYIQAQTLAKRPGQMYFQNIEAAVEGSLVSNWFRGMHIDGTLAPDYAILGVRSVQGHKVIFTGCADAGKTVYLQYVEHVCISGLQIFGSLGEGMTIEGDCNNIMLPGLINDGPTYINDTTAVNITGATNASPTVLHAVAHGWPIGSNPQINVMGVGGNTGANGLWEGHPTDADHIALYGITYPPMSAPVDTSGGSAYTSGGTVQSTSPLDVNVMGKTSVFEVNALGSSGSASLTHNINPNFAPNGVSLFSKSPNFVFRSPRAPKEKIEVVNTTISAVTGDGTSYQVSFNTLDLDANSDLLSTPGPWTYLFINVAGYYRVRARVTLTGVSALNTYAIIRIGVNTGGGGSTKRVTISAQTSGTETYDVEDVVLLNQGDAVKAYITVAGNASKNCNVFGDTSSGLTILSAELL